jgi:hypothetical protein
MDGRGGGGGGGGGGGDGQPPSRGNVRHFGEGGGAARGQPILGFWTRLERGRAENPTKKDMTRLKGG